MNEQVTAEDVRRLLCAYDVALNAADSLPPLVRIASRPRRWTMFEPLRRLPRPTIGTSTIVTYHVWRSTTALVHRYARLAATRGLTEEDEKACALVKTFRESIVEIRWKFIVPALLVTAVIALNTASALLLDGVTALASVSFLVVGPSQRPDQPVVSDELVEAVTGTMSGLRPDSFNDLFTALGNAGPYGVLILAATVIAAAYLVLRPLPPAFRVKRILFNLAPEGHVDLARTTSTWNVTRSGGLYEVESMLFTRLGARPPNEINLDLWLSAVAAVALTWLSLANLWSDVRQFPEYLGIDLAGAGIVVGLATARFVWLLRTAKARRRISSETEPPVGFVAPFAERVVETRSVLETASLGMLSWLVVYPAGIVGLPSPVWIRLVRERRDLERARRRARGLPGRLPSRRVWPALGSAILLWPIAPLPMAIHLTKLIRLQPPGVGSARRTRAWLVPLLTAATLLVWFDVFYLLEHNETWSGITLLPMWASLTIGFGAIQHEHNALIRHAGEPLPHDDPLYRPELRTEQGPMPITVSVQELEAPHDRTVGTEP